MNILFLSTWYPDPPDNGSKLRAHHLIRALSREHCVTVVAFQPGAAHSVPQSQEHSVDNVSLWSVPQDPFRYVSLPQIVKYAIPIPLAVWPSSMMQRAVDNVAHSTRWDAVVAFQIPAARYALDIEYTARVFDIDTSLSFMGAERLAAQKATLQRLRARVSLYKARRYEARMARCFDYCTVVSPLEVGYVAGMVGNAAKVAVVPNGVDCTHNRPGLAPARPGALVYNGALTYSANYEAMQWFLGAIYPRIRQAIPKASLAITGSTAGVDIKGLVLDDSVTLTGYVDDVRLPVAAASVCVVPLRQGGGTRLKILEAMALGTPVVATSKGAEGLDAVDGEHLLIADTPETFAARTVALLHDEPLRRRLAANARRLVEERYEWRQIGAQFVALVEQAAVRKGAGQPAWPG